MSTQVVIAHIIALPGTAGQLRSRLTEVVEASTLEPGVLRYLLHEAPDSPGQFTLVEVYESDAAFADHLASAHVTGLLGELDQLAQPNPVIVQTAPIAVGTSAKASW